MANPTDSAASVIKASPGTMVAAFIGLTLVLLAVKGASAAASKASSVIAEAKNRTVAAVSAPAATAEGDTGGW